MPWKAEGAAGGGRSRTGAESTEPGGDTGAPAGELRACRGRPATCGGRAGGRGEEEVTWRESGQLGCGVRVESAGSPLAST